MTTTDNEWLRNRFAGEAVMEQTNDWQKSTEGIPDGLAAEHSVGANDMVAAPTFDWATATAEEKVRRTWPDAHEHAISFDIWAKTQYGDER